jgi:acetate kinase
MKPGKFRILTINGGSSSIEFALFEAGDSLRRILEGEMERIGLPEATLRGDRLTDEERRIARTRCRVLGTEMEKEQDHEN